MPKKRKEEDWPTYRMFGAKVQQLRMALGWTQEELAKKVGFERTSVNLIENGKQRVLLHEVDNFSRAFGCTPKQLLRGMWT